MKRPLAVVGLSMLSVMSVVCFVNNVGFTLSVCAALFVLLVISLIFKKCRRTVFLPTVFMSAIVGCLLLLCITLFSYLPAVNSVSQNAQITAKVLEYPTFSQEKGRYYCVASLKSIDGKEVHGKVRLSLPGSQSWIKCDSDLIKPGDTVTFIGNSYVIAEDYKEIHNNYKSKKIYVGAYPTGEVTVTQGKHGVRYFMLTVRQKAIEKIRLFFTERTAGVLISVLTGDKTYLDSGIYDKFKTSGVAHIMAVSGLHLSIWIFLIIDVIQKRNGDLMKASVFLMLFVVFIMAFALFSGSVMRAGFMMLLYLSGFIFRRRSDSLNSLGFAVIVILLINPFACINSGFLMSVISTFSIIAFALPYSQIINQKLIYKIKNEDISKLTSSVVLCILMSFFAQLSTLPIQIGLFGTVSLVSIITNVLFLPVVMPLLVCAGIFCVLSFVPIVSNLIGYAAIFIVGYCTRVVNTLSSFKFSCVSVSSSVTPIVTVSVILLLCGFYFLLQKNKTILTKTLG